MSEHDLAAQQTLRLIATRRWPANVASRAADPGTVGGVSCRLGDASCASAHAASISRSRGTQRASIHGSLLRLQRQFGNRYVGQVLRQIGAVDRDIGGTDAIERSIDAARGSGHGMDHGTRRRMELAFGADFSNVRIHTDARADGLSRSLSARAFATGQDVFFRQGEYNPGTSSGRELLAHELTHVVQQNGDGIRRKMTVSQPGDAHELEADQMARAVIQQENAPAGIPHPVSRQEEDERPVAAKRDAVGLYRQPEALRPEDEEHKKKLQMKADTVFRQEEEPPAE